METVIKVTKEVAKEVAIVAAKATIATYVSYKVGEFIGRKVAERAIARSKAAADE